MPNEKDRQDEHDDGQEKREESLAPTSQHEPVERETIQGKRAIGEKAPKQSHKLAKSWEFWAVLFTNVLLVFFTGGIYWATRDYAAIAKGQLEVMRGQLKAMSDTLESTRSIADAAMSQADATQKSVDLAAKNAEMIRASQRAWVGATGVKMVSGPPSSNEIAVETIFRNTGSTPAVDVRTNTNLTLSRVPIAEVPEDEAFEGKRGSSPSIGVLFPTGTSYASVVNTMSFSEEVMTALEAENVWLFLFGTVEYRDSLGKHMTRFCAFYKIKPSRDFYFCPRFNSAN